MNYCTEFEHPTAEAIARLRKSIDSWDAVTGKRLASHFERLQRKQESELAQLRAIRRDLQRLPLEHPLRKQIAKDIFGQVRFHQAAAQRTARRLIQDADTGTESDT